MSRDTERPQVALQLYTVRDQAGQDFAGTVRKVAAMGYAGVEFAGYGDLSAQEMKALLAETGLKAVGTHLGLYELTGEQLDKSIEYCHTIGCSTIIMPWLTEEWRTLKGIQELAPRFNAIGRRCLDEGITFGYHNHDFEFKPLDGRTWFDYFLDATDPELVKIEVDVFWVAHGGQDPLSMLRTLGKRVALMHFEDMAADGSTAEVGRGTLDMKSFTDFARERGLWPIVEHDHPAVSELESARLALEYFR